jgi:hypothetical protein
MQKAEKGPARYANTGLQAGPAASRWRLQSSIWWRVKHRWPELCKRLCCSKVTNPKPPTQASLADEFRNFFATEAQRPEHGVLPEGLRRREHRAKLGLSGHHVAFAGVQL